MSKQLSQQAPAASSYAFQVWLGQWRLNTLDPRGCLFVLRFVLSAFRSRRPEDPFWAFLGDYLALESDELDSAQTARLLLEQAVALNPEGARGLLEHLSQSYATPGDRFFWSTVGDAIQLYAVAPFSGHKGASA